MDMLELVLWVVGALVGYRLIRCITTPLLRRCGLYRYHSRMLFTMPFSRGVLDLHAGTSWDFLTMTGITPAVILEQMALGMAGLCDAIASGQIDPATTIRGHIHYFNESTMRSFGFQVRHANFFERFLFGLNFVELCLLQSIARRRLSIVVPSRMRIIYCRAGDLVPHKDRYLHAAARIAGRAARRVPAGSRIASELQEAA